MMRFRRIAALILALTLLLSLMPADAGAAKRPASRPRAAGPTAPADAWEAGAGDDTPSVATSVTTLFAPVGSNTYAIQQHTIDAAPSNSSVCDQDWFSLTVTDDDYADGTSYLIEVDSRATSRSFYITEMYGPGLSNVDPQMPPGIEETDDQVTLTGCFEIGWGDVWHDDNAVSTLAFEPPSPGDYYFRVRPWRNPDDGSSWANYGDVAGAYDLRLKKGFMSRRGGVDRVATAVQVSRELFPDNVLTEGGSDAFGDAVVVANGWNYPDALAGSALAGAISAPLLLTSTRGLSAGTSAEIDRLKPQKIYILGSTSAVSSAVETTLRGKLANPAGCERLEGADRVQTATRIARELYENGANNPLRGAFVVNGWSFADALSAAPLASLTNMPILLTHTYNLDVATRAAIEAYGIEDVIIVGGPSAVSPGVMTELQTLLGGADHVRRVYGANRYETASEFAAWASALRDAAGDAESGYTVGTVANPTLMQALNPNNIGVASGSNFPDALAGGVWCGRAHAPLLLTPATSMSPYIFSPTHVTPTGGDDYWSEVIEGTGFGFTRSYLFGGRPAVSDATFLQLDSITGAAGSLY